MTPEKKIDELFKRIIELNIRLIWRENTEEVVRDLLMKSNMPIGEVEEVFYFLNLPNNKLKYTIEEREKKDYILEMI